MTKPVNKAAGCGKSKKKKMRKYASPQKAAMTLTRKYLQAQQKRAELELGETLLRLPQEESQRVARNLEKQAIGEGALQYLRDVVQEAGSRTQGLFDQLPEQLRGPLRNALLGSALGAGAGGLAGAVGDGTIGGGALQGAVAGGAIGGGGTLAYEALKRRGLLDGGTEQIKQLNDAIQSADQEDASNYFGNTAGTLGGLYGVNAADRAVGGLRPDWAIMAEDVGSHSNRMDLIRRLEGWLGDKPQASERMGADAVKEFIEMMSKQTSGPDAILAAKGFAGGAKSGDLQAVARALSESQSPGMQFLPRNMVGRLSETLGTNVDSPVSRALIGANSALSRPRLTGLAGALTSGALLGGAYGLDRLNGLDVQRDVASPEDIASLREQLNSP